MNGLYYSLFNPRKGLFILPMFWIMTLLPVFIGIILGQKVWQSYSFELSEAGYSTFFNISKLPLTVMTLCFPMAALAMRFHSTLQKAVSIDQVYYAQQQLNLDNIVATSHHLLALIWKIQDLVDAPNSMHREILPALELNTIAEKIEEHYESLLSKDNLLHMSHNAMAITLKLHGQIAGLSIQLKRTSKEGWPNSEIDVLPADKVAELNRMLEDLDKEIRLMKKDAHQRFNTFMKSSSAFELDE